MSETKMQYAKMNGNFYPVGESMPRLPAGFYNVVSSGFAWGVSPAKPVSDDLLDIPGTPADDINRDISKFLETKDRYMRVGLTHKRGYLFYGPPGTGKTSLGLMIARRFIANADGVVFYIPSSHHLHGATEIIRAVEPGRPAMFLMEEADSFLNDTHALSILDGELSLAGAVFVGMTNYKDKMPPRIANRPGRFDRVTYIGAPPRQVQVAYLQRLVDKLGEALPKVPELLAETLDGITLSMAHLREAFISHVLMGVAPEEIRRRFEQMAKDGNGDPEVEKPVCYGCEGPLDESGDCNNSDCSESPDYNPDES